MPIAKRISPAPRIQCSCPFSYGGYSADYREHREARYAKLGKDPNCCGKFATHIINDKPLCSTHAGQEALRIMEEATYVS